MSRLMIVDRLWAVLAALLAAVTCAACLYLYLGRESALRAVSEARREHADVQARWAKERELLMAQALAESEKARQVEAQWRQKQVEVQTHAQERIRVLQVDATRARDAVDVLQRRAEVIAAQCANPVRDQAGADPSFAPRGSAAADPGVVLTNVLRGVAQAAAELAAIADARGAAGAACQKAYEVLK